MGVSMDMRSRDHDQVPLHIEVATFTPQGEKEDFKQFVARIQMAYERTRAELTLLGRSDMLPHEDTLVHLIYFRVFCKFPYVWQQCI